MAVMKALQLPAAAAAAALLSASVAGATTPSTTPGAATRAAVPGLPASWTAVAHGSDGGVVFAGRIANREVPSDRRSSAVYLPPGYSAKRQYPVVYLLSGMAGDPSSFYDGLHLADVADSLIASGASKPFIAVMPVAGPTVNPDSGEWAGVWEDFVVQDVVPWVDAHLSTLATPAGRALAGLCAGGYGAVDIGLRHPGLFGTLESWEGYFAPVFRDGPFVRASASVLAAHNPTLLVRHQAASLRRDGVRFYVSVGGNHGAVLRAWSLEFAHELTDLRLAHELWLLPKSERHHFWSATLPSALVYADAGFPVS
jgi:enterochelin esterase-like enzyme